MNYTTSSILYRSLLAPLRGTLTKNVVCNNYWRHQDSFHQQMHLFIKNIKCENVQLKYLFVCSYMFRSNWTILRDRMLSLAKATILWN
jgi:hypothetical protein